MRPTAERARSVVVVIDVLRAFTVAAYAFAGGAEELWLVREVEEALACARRTPTSCWRARWGGRVVAQRTGAGRRARVAR